MGTKTPNHISRREFVKGFTVLASTLMGMMIGLPAVGYLLSPALKRTSGSDDWVQAGAPEDFPVREPALFSFTRAKVDQRNGGMSPA